MTFHSQACIVFFDFMWLLMQCTMTLSLLTLCGGGKKRQQTKGAAEPNKSTQPPFGESAVPVNHGSVAMSTTLAGTSKETKSSKTREDTKTDEKEKKKSERKESLGEKKDEKKNGGTKEEDKKAERPKKEKTPDNVEAPRKEYPEVKEPTASAKRRREEQLEKEKKAKIAAGFYQDKSDEDDTLEKIKSLEMEHTEKSAKNSVKSKKK